MQVSSTQPLLPTASFAPNSGGRCDSVMMTGSVFNIVNGLYSRLVSTPDIYRRSDNLQIPGLLIKLAPQQWCVSFAFSTVDFNTLTVPDVLKRCNSGLQCCMLISDTVQVDDPNAVWIVNILENKGKQDGGIKLTCENNAKGLLLLILN